MTARVPLAERWARPAVLGIVNVTPDSFSDGGERLAPGDAIAAGRAMVAAGACAVDVGGESTRPGAPAVPAALELERIAPVVEGLRGLPLSIDTSKAEVARFALAAGAELVNDVTALRGDPELAGVVADAGASLCLMHMQGDPLTMQQNPVYGDVVDDVRAFLEGRLTAAVAAGVAEEQICLDPGFGFGKTPDQNLALLNGLPRLAELGRPLLVGLSRKSTLAKITGGADARVASDDASLAAAVVAYTRGAAIFRVHAVAPHVDALAVAAACTRGTVTA
ncbi:MAG: dihydropteroate synthase [Gaiellales bacterium]